MGIGIIIGMASLTVASAVGQHILSSIGKQSEAQWIDLATKCLIIGTAVTAFFKVVTDIKKLG